MQRLPFHLRTKFVEVADAIKQSGKKPNINDISASVAAKARAANNPVFGGVMEVTPDSKRSGTKPKPSLKRVAHRPPVLPRLTPKEPCQATKATSQGVVQRVYI